MNSKPQKIRCCLTQVSVLLLFQLISSNTFADFILTAPPRESAEVGRDTYEPIAKRISNLIGRKVVYEQPNNWFQYGIKMRSGAYDIIFDGPHFTAWRIKTLAHIPVATLPGKLKFILFADDGDDSLNSISDLDQKIMCGMKAPNLATNIIMLEFADVSTKPMIYESNGFANVYKNFRDASCQAAVLRDQAFYKLTLNDPSVKIIHITEPLPNQTITISPNLKKYSRIISRFFTSDEGSYISKKLLTRFSKKNPKFISANRSDYVGVEKYLHGFVKGW